MTDLLPCPFCGGKAYLTASSDGYGVECRNELCVKTIMQEHSTEAEAIAAWNTRYHFGLTDEDYNILLDEMGIAKPERIAHWQPTFIDGKPTATCSLCGAVEWDYDEDEPWEYCHGCGAKVVE